jgi:hypothetical protein
VRRSKETGRTAAQKHRSAWLLPRKKPRRFLTMVLTLWTKVV